MCKGKNNVNKVIKKGCRKAWGMAQMVKCLTNKLDALSSNPRTNTKKVGNKGKEYKIQYGKLVKYNSIIIK